MIIVSGRTFDHRETLKRLRGQWNQTDRVWTFDHLRPEQIAQLRALVGVSVVVNDTPAPLDIAIDIDDLIDLEDEPPVRPAFTGKTIMFGDDDRFLGHFADPNPVAFYGFSSLDRFAEFVAGLRERRLSGSMGEAWSTHQRYREWSGTDSMAHAVGLAREGWSEGVDDLIDLDIPHATRKRRQNVLAGGGVNVGRMLSGDPAHMTRRTKQPGRKVVTLFVEASMAAIITPQNAVTRARLIAAMSDALEQHSYSCEIVAVNTTNSRNTTYQVAVTLKAAGERLNLLDVVFALGHPSFKRRLIFAAVANCNELQHFWASGGRSGESFNGDHRTGKNEFYFPKLTPQQQNKIDQHEPLSMMQFIKPKGLDI